MPPSFVALRPNARSRPEWMAPRGLHWSVAAWSDGRKIIRFLSDGRSLL